MKKNKVVITMPKRKKGGPFISQSRIIQSSLKEKYEFFPIYIPRIRKLLNPKIFWSLVKKIRGISPDLFHYYGLQMDGFITLLLLMVSSRKTPRILVVRGSSDEALKFNWFFRIIVRIMERFTLKHSNIVYGVSKYVSSWEKIKNIGKKYYGHIYNFMPEETIYNKNKIDNFRKKLKISRSDIVFISTGRIEIEKGYSELEKLISFDNYGKNIIFLIVGDGSYLNKMKKTLSIKNARVIFTDFVSNVDTFLSISDYFISLSWHETLGNSIIEALNFGIPCITTGVGGVSELIENDTNGYIVNKDNIGHVNKILKKVIFDEKNKFSRKKIKTHIKKIINNDEIEAKINEIYLRMIKKF